MSPLKDVRKAALGAALLASANLFAGCAVPSRESKNVTTSVVAPPTSAPKDNLIRMPETLVVAGPPEERALADLDETQLFDCGVRAFDKAEWPRAAACFGRLVDAFPSSDRYGPALFNNGLALERLKRWDDALARWETALERLQRIGAQQNQHLKTDFAHATGPSSDELDVTFHAAYAEHELGRLDAAAARLKGVADRAGVPDSRRGEALVQEAVCLVEKVDLLRKNGETDPAKLEGRGAGEHLLREALDLYAKAGTDGEADPALLAQAEFWIGEIYRSYFDEIRLDPGRDNEQALLDTLESKAQFLLSAQGHYLRAIRHGDGEWATASGYRVGELYESLHDSMVNAPVPLTLKTAELQAAYREELKKKVRVLLDKAMRIYAQTLQTAQRVNATSDYVRKTNEALERMKALLVEQPPPGKPAPRTN